MGILVGSIVGCCRSSVFKLIIRDAFRLLFDWLGDKRLKEIICFREGFYKEIVVRSKRFSDVFFSVFF